MVSGNNKLPKNTKMFLFPVLCISNTFLSILADPSNADFWIKVIDVSTPLPFKLPFNRNGTVSKAPNTILLVRLWFSLPTFYSILRPDFGTFQPSWPPFLLLHCLLELPRLLYDSFSLLLSTSTKSGLLHVASMLWSVCMLKSQRSL